VIALKVRRSYLLSETGGAEEISQKQDLWTYAVFIAALCHDLAKVAVDQVLIIYDENHQQQIGSLGSNLLMNKDNGIPQNLYIIGSINCMKKPRRY
jgi:hypothetical protein